MNKERVIKKKYLFTYISLILAIVFFIIGGAYSSRAETLTYDANGNLKVDPTSGKKYEYDEENRPVKVTNSQDAPILETEYDALGNKVKTKDYSSSNCGQTYTTYAYHGSDEYKVDCAGVATPIRENVGVAVVNHQNNQPTNTQVVYPHTDILGSPRVLTNNLGNVVEKYDYEPYGKQIVTNPAQPGVLLQENVIGFTGHRIEKSVKLLDTPNRNYDAELGRWLERDKLGYVDGENLYEYVKSSPLDGVDSSGLVRDDHFRGQYDVEGSFGAPWGGDTGSYIKGGATGVGKFVMGAWLGTSRLLNLVNAADNSEGVAAVKDIATGVSDKYNSYSSAGYAMDDSVYYTTMDFLGPGRVFNGPYRVDSLGTRELSPEEAGEEITSGVLATGSSSAMLYSVGSTLSRAGAITRANCKCSPSPAGHLRTGGIGKANDVGRSNIAKATGEKVARAPIEIPLSLAEANRKFRNILYNLKSVPIEYKTIVSTSSDRPVQLYGIVTKKDNFILIDKITIYPKIEYWNPLPKREQLPLMLSIRRMVEESVKDAKLKGINELRIRYSRDPWGSTGKNMDVIMENGKVRYIEKTIKIFCDE